MFLYLHNYTLCLSVKNDPNGQYNNFGFFLKYPVLLLDMSKMTFRLKIEIIKIAQFCDILKNTHLARDRLQLFFLLYITEMCINCIDSTIGIS